MIWPAFTETPVLLAFIQTKNNERVNIKVRNVDSTSNQYLRTHSRQVPTEVPYPTLYSAESQKLIT